MYGFQQGWLYEMAVVQALKTVPFILIIGVLKHIFIKGQILVPERNWYL